MSAGIRETYDPLREMTRRFHVSKDSRATQTNNDGAARRVVAALGPARTCIDIHHQTGCTAAGLLPLSPPMYSARCEIEFVHPPRIPPATDILLAPVYIPRQRFERVEANDDRIETKIFGKSLVNIVRDAVISLLMEWTNY